MDDEGPKAGHSQWKLIHVKFIWNTCCHFKNKIITLGDDLEVGGGEGVQEEEDSQVLGLRQQRGYDE